MSVYTDNVGIWVPDNLIEQYNLLKGLTLNDVEKRIKIGILDDDKCKSGEVETLFIVRADLKGFDPDPVLTEKHKSIDN